MIVGGGFAGVWAAMGAARALRQGRAEGEVEITLVSPGDSLVIRPRLHESDLGGVHVPLDCLLPPVGVERRRASVEAIDVDRRTLTLAGDSPGELRYDQLVLSAGSAVSLPEAAGVHCVDTYAQAVALHDAVELLGAQPDQRFSATVVGAGFSGLEVAAELSDMLRAAAKAARVPPEEVSVRLIEQAATIAPEFGLKARTVIEEALGSLGVESQVGAHVAEVDEDRVMLSGGERIDTSLTVWTVGPRASSLNEQLGLRLDRHGRLSVDSHMATGADGVWAAGDSARVSVDDEHLALMSCQHAIPQGRQAGENAAAAVLGRSLAHYRQPLYLTCLDLGSAGALITSGFERDTIVATGQRGKRFKRFVNRSLIYPPASEKATDLLKLGKLTPPGRVAATLQRMALRSGVVRTALIARGEDRAERYSAM